MLAIEVEHLSKRYASGVLALKDFSLKINQGNFYAILGPNGAGKSTFIGILTSLVRKSGGRVNVLGHDLDAEPEKVKRLVGLVPQEFNCNFFEQPLDILCTQAGYYGIPRREALPRAEKNLKLLDLWNHRNLPARSLSGGMKRRLMIARALMHEPKVLFLDEPTAGVDVEIRRSMWELLRKMNKEGVTIILTTHYLEEVEQLCDRVAIIDKGGKLDDTTIPELISHLAKETYVMTVTGRPKLEDLAFPGAVFAYNGGDLEMTIDTGMVLNDVFKYLDSKHIVVKSMRTKVNRLEELFYNLVTRKDG